MSHFDRISDVYASNSDQYNRELLVKVADLLNPRVAGKTILDIGNGGYFRFDATLPNSITVIDRSEPMLRNITNENVIKIVGDARQLSDIYDETYDLVMICYCIHHVNGSTFDSALDALNTIVARAFCKLKAGGRLIVIEPILNPFLHFLERLLYGPIFGFMRLMKKDMIFFHADDSVKQAFRMASRRPDIHIETIEIKLTQPIDPLAGSFPGIIKLPAWLQYSSQVLYEVRK